jgi:methionyl-tRNA synthetase
MSKFIITITPPTPNGDLHIGHLAGPFLSADIFTRTQRQKGHDCVFVSYSDDYQSYMLRRGREQGREPALIGEENTRKIKISLQMAGIEIDHWMTSLDNTYFRDAVLELYHHGVNNHNIYQKNVLAPYCRACNTWGYEAFGRGQCSSCGQDSDASQCEECACAPNYLYMKNFKCKLCGGEHEWVEKEHAYLNISKNVRKLRTWLSDSAVRLNSQAFVERELAPTPQDWQITRHGDAGLDIGQPNLGKAHTWFMGMAGYIAATREHFTVNQQTPQLFDAFWRADDTTLVKFLGYDCLYSHGIAYPILLDGGPYGKKNQRLYTNMFLKLNGLNLSTSRNHAIWIRDLVSDYDTDSVRLYMALLAPEEHESDFVETQFVTWHRDFYQEKLEALTVAATHESPAFWLDGMQRSEHKLLCEVYNRWSAVTSADSFSSRNLASLAVELYELAYSRLQAQKPLYYLVALASCISAPITPTLSRQMQKRCGFNEPLILDNLINANFLDYSI